MQVLRNLAAGCNGLFCAGKWSRTQLQQYQAARLRALVRHASNNVPFHRRRLHAAGVDWRLIRTIDDLARIPWYDRREIREAAPEDLLADGTNCATLTERHTSGTSGQPMTIRRTHIEERLLHAFRLRTMFAYGLHFRDQRMGLRHENRMENAPWARLGFLRYHSVRAYDGVKSLRTRFLSLRPEVVEGWAASLAELAGEITAEDRQTHSPRFIAAGAEPVTPDRRRRIETGFGARVYDVYGSEEFNLIAAECPHTGLLHITEAAVVVEVLRDGSPVLPGETGEVVVTALHSYAMPFLRFRLGDVARLGPAPCPCGAPFATLAGLEGREEDVFPLPDGRLLIPHVLVLPLMQTCPWIRKFQLVQELPDLLRLKVVAAPDVADVEARLAGWRQDSQQQCGDGVRIVVEQLSGIPNQPSGKYRSIVSLVKRDGR
jgi:phenylacetate-CoA ligase